MSKSDFFPFCVHCFSFYDVERNLIIFRLWWLFKQCADLEYIDIGGNIRITGQVYILLGLGTLRFQYSTLTK